MVCNGTGICNDPFGCSSPLNVELNKFDMLTKELYELEQRVKEVENRLRSHVAIGEYCPHKG